MTGGRLMLAIRLTPDIEKRLDNLSRKTGRTKTYYARAAIVEYLDDLEDIYLAEKRLEDIRSGKSKTIPIDEIMRRYDLEG
jgi:RHH-type rel operon transcriptional repressor/antitoxin RelB